jgi:Lon protease-like protein
MVSAFVQKFEELPSALPLFPLGGVLLLPRGSLPLNIFEQRYVAMVDDAIRSDRLIGMVQPREDGTLYDVGCAGRIVSYNETSDGRYEIVLDGVCRFKVEQEWPQEKGYRRAKVQWSGYDHDMKVVDCLDMDRSRLNGLLKEYFQLNGLTCSWAAVEGAPDEKLITTLAMICPFESHEKQALLEAGCCKERAQLFMTFLEMATGQSHCHCKH